MREWMRWGVAALALALASGCGEGVDMDAITVGSDMGFGGGNNGGAPAPSNNSIGDMSPAGPGDMGEPFVPEEEEFLVRAIAATSSYVFVPNSAEGGRTVARIDGRDLSVRPLQVGQRPTQVRAAEIEGLGAVAYVLCEGDSTLAIIRADELARDGQGRGRVDLLELPDEVNTLHLAPDGRHLLATIDPDQPLLDGTSVASLQTMALIRLGDAPGEDEVFELSVTRLIRDVEFDEQGRWAFIVGQEGVHRIELAEVDGDRFVPPLDLGLDDAVFEPQDREVEVSASGELMVVRSSQFEGVALFELDASGLARQRLVELPVPPTDIDLVGQRAPERLRVLATLRGSSQLALLDVDEILASAAERAPPAQLVELGFQAGLAQITPEGERALVYTTLDPTPSMGVLGLGGLELEALPLRNQIRSVAVSPEGASAVVVHAPQQGQPADGAPPHELFRYSEGLTLLDLDTGYRRPVILDATPEDLIMTSLPGRDEAIVYVMLRSPQAARQGVMRVDLGSYRTDFVALPRPPLQLGVVAGKVFVSQDAGQGRITFLDIETNAQRTISGYELNARID